MRCGGDDHVTYLHVLAFGFPGLAADAAAARQLNTPAQRILDLELMIVSLQCVGLAQKLYLALANQVRPGIG